MYDYLKIGRASDLKDAKEVRIYRLLEIFPGALSWLTLLGAFFLSWRAPFFISYALIILVIFWFLRSVYLSFHLATGFRRMERYKKIDWLKKLQNLPSDQCSLSIDNWRDIYHLILLPNYKEPLNVIEETLQSLVYSDYPKDRMIVVLSFEERAGTERKGVAQAIKEKFSNSFFKLLVTFHPDNLPREIRGHGANDAWAAEKAKESVIDPLNISYERIIVSAFDIDTHVFPRYFSCLTYHYLTCQKPTRTSFQPIPLYNNNIWQATPFSQISSFSASFWQIMCQERPEKLVTFSSHSMSFKALVEVGFKQRNIIADDSRIFWQCFFRYNGDYYVQPIFYPISMDANIGKNFFHTLKNMYKQKKRWAYGVEDIPYFLFACWKNKKVPFKQKLSRGLELISGHWTWATSSFLIFTLGWLPIFMGEIEFAHSLLAYSVPRLASRVMTFAMLGLISSIWLSLHLLPSPPVKTNKFKYILFVLSWFMIPLEMMVFGSLPALDAHTRFMTGKYMLEFWVTPKSRR